MSEVVAGEAARLPSATPFQRLRAAVVGALAGLACRLPEAPLVALADAVGRLWYRLAPADAEQARRNLGRVATWCAEHGQGSAAVRAAATDPRALERLVRAAFRHRARYYLEVLRVPTYDARYLAERLLVETPAVIEEALGRPGGLVLVGLHFGSLEIPSLYVIQRRGRPAVAPMETIPDPALQAWFVRTRGALGVRLVDLKAARRELAAALERGELVGLIADRDLTGAGVEVPLFGSPCPLPIGPALLALEHDVPLYVGVAWRTGDRRYRGRLEPLPVPTEGSRRQRILAVLEAEARAFERLVAVAPEQWWAVFFPLWPDLAVRPRRRARRGAAPPTDAGTGGSRR
jgi:lauroyl/myristoyl acyltransferase